MTKKPISKIKTFQMALHFASIAPILVGELLIILVYFDCSGITQYEGHYIGACNSKIPVFITAANAAITAFILFFNLPKYGIKRIVLNCIWKCLFIALSLYIPDECKGYTYLLYALIPIIILSNAIAGILSALAIFVNAIYKK